jgi:hypothetical protein
VEDGGLTIELVGEHDLDLVAEIRVDRGPGDLTVVGHALLEHTRFDLPLDLIRGQFEHLGAVGIDPGMQELPTSALRLGRNSAVRAASASSISWGDIVACAEWSTSPPADAPSVPRPSATVMTPFIPPSACPGTEQMRS